MTGRENPMREKELCKIKLAENVVCIRTKWCIEFDTRDWKGYNFLCDNIKLDRTISKVS